MIASKSGEYLAAGLPIICNKSLSGIADFVEQNQIGLTYEIGKEDQLVPQLKNLFSNYNQTSKSCRNLAEEHFDLKRNIDRIDQEITTLCAQ